MSATTKAGSRYRRIAMLGEGGMAHVFLALSRGMSGISKLVVIKEIRPELAEDDEYKKLFLDEARLATRLNHPNVVQTYDVGQEGNRLFLTMEYLEGQSFHHVLGRCARKTLTFEMQLRILADILGALAYAHDLTDFDGTPLHVVHRDVSPQNIFITYEGTAKLVDFGIAHSSARSAARTQTGVFKGKPTYASPEQVTSDRVDHRSDIFSVGVMLWEAAAGHRMWKGRQELAVLVELANGRLPSLRDACPQVAPEIEAMCARALAPNPADRYATAAEFQADIERYLDTCPSRPTTRDIGRVVVAAFADERSGIRARIDQITRAAKDDLEWSEPEATALPRITERPGALKDGSGGATPVSTQNAISEASAPSAKRSAPKIALFAAVVVAFCGLGVWAATSRKSVGSASATTSSSPASTQSSTATAVTSTTSAVSASTTTDAPNGPASARITVRLRAEPPSAQLQVDGVAIAGNPAELAVAPDSSMHLVRATASGYAPREQLVAFAKDTSVELELVRSGAPTSKKAKASEKSGSATTATTSKKIDEQDPYHP